MAPIVANGVARYTVNGTFAGRPVANIIDMDIETTGSVVDRAAAVAAQAGIVINEWCDHVLPLVVDDYVFTSVSWVDLDSLNGSTGERTSTDQETLPQAGSSTGAPLPGNVAARVNKATVAQRGQRQGRMYLVGVPESVTPSGEPNSIDAATAESWSDSLNSMLGNLNQSEGDIGTEYTSEMVVVHTSEGEYESQSVVQSLTVERLLGSQRRRLRG